MQFRTDRNYVAHDSGETEGTSLVRFFLHQPWQKAEDTSMRARAKVRLDEKIHFTFSISPLLNIGIWSPPMRAHTALLHLRLSFRSSFVVVTVYLSEGCAGGSRHKAVTGKETAATHLSQERGSLDFVACVVALLLVCDLGRKIKEACYSYQRGGTVLSDVDIPWNYVWWENSCSWLWATVQP